MDDDGTDGNGRTTTKGRTTGRTDRQRTATATATMGQDWTNGMDDDDGMDDGTDVWTEDDGDDGTDTAGRTRRDGRTIYSFSLFQKFTYGTVTDFIMSQYVDYVMTLPGTHYETCQIAASEYAQPADSNEFHF